MKRLTPSSIGSVLAAATLLDSARRARTGQVGTTEERIFRMVNDRSDRFIVPVWLMMQSGSLAAVFVVAADSLRRGRTRRAAATAVVGTAVWGGVKAVKPLIGRGRPDRHLADVTVRGKRQGGLGYPSGHAAVAVTLAMASTGHCRRPARAAALGVAAVTGVARLYVGAHLPLDVAGGLAVGALGGRLAEAVVAERRRPAGR